VVVAEPADLARYLDLVEEIADWLAMCGIRQWTPGQFRASAAYYAESIERHEVYLAFLGDALVGTLRVLAEEPIVWPEIVEDDAVYVHTLGVGRRWAHLALGSQLLNWAASRAASLGKSFVRLDCVSGNAFLRRYYLDAGFADRGDIDAPFPDPIGTLRLRRYEKRIRPADR
jgi:GNAT superfamily N-acetyltransferase